VRTSYQGVDLERVARMLDRRWFVVATGLDGQAHHSYSHLLHGFAGGDTGQPFLLQEQGATWIRPGASMIVRVLSTEGDPEQVAGLSAHAVMNSNGTHAVLQSNIEGEKAAFLALLLPVAVGEQPPPILPFDAGLGRVGVVLGPEAPGEAAWFLVASQPGLDPEATLLLPDGREVPASGLLTVTR
jgi:hypothetical protein